MDSYQVFPTGAISFGDLQNNSAQAFFTVGGTAYFKSNVQIGAITDVETVLGTISTPPTLISHDVGAPNVGSSSNINNYYVLSNGINYEIHLGGRGGYGLTYTYLYLQSAYTPP